MEEAYMDQQVLREEGTIFCNDNGCWIDSETQTVYNENPELEEIRKKLYSTKDFTEASDETKEATFVSDTKLLLDDGFTLVESSPFIQDQTNDNLFAPVQEKKKVKPAPVGIFAPVVLGAVNVMGRKELNKLRAEVIAMHSKVITKFVETTDTKFGQIALEKMFEAADKDGDGQLSKEEIRDALQALGFDWI